MTINFSVDSLVWTPIYDNYNKDTFGGIDGAFLRLMFSEPIAARFIKLQLQETNFFHLQQVEIFGFAIAGEESST